MTRPATAWVGVAVVLAAAALLGWRLPPERLDWQPALALGQPWRAWTAVGVHYSPAHLIGNLAGAAAVGALGIEARAPHWSAWSWAIAWPLTQVGLLAEPALLHYGGLSGVLHAGVAVIAVVLLWAPSTPTRRGVGLALLAGLIVKILFEAPWGAPLRHPAGIDIAVAPLAHASGLVAGLVCAVVARLAAHHGHLGGPQGNRSA